MPARQLVIDQEIARSAEEGEMLAQPVKQIDRNWQSANRLDTQIPSGSNIHSDASHQPVHCEASSSGSGIGGSTLTVRNGARSASNAGRGGFRSVLARGGFTTAPATKPPLTGSNVRYGYPVAGPSRGYQVEAPSWRIRAASVTPTVLEDSRYGSLDDGLDDLKNIEVETPPFYLRAASLTPTVLEDDRDGSPDEGLNVLEDSEVEAPSSFYREGSLTPTLPDEDLPPTEEILPPYRAHGPAHRHGVDGSWVTDWSTGERTRETPTHAEIERASDRMSHIRSLSFGQLSEASTEPDEGYAGRTPTPSVSGTPRWPFL